MPSEIDDGWYWEPNAENFFTNAPLPPNTSLLSLLWPKPEVLVDELNAITEKTKAKLVEVGEGKKKGKLNTSNKKGESTITTKENELPMGLEQYSSDIGIGYKFMVSIMNEQAKQEEESSGSYFDVAYNWFLNRASIHSLCCDVNSASMVTVVQAKDHSYRAIMSSPSNFLSWVRGKDYWVPTHMAPVWSEFSDYLMDKPHVDKWSPYGDWPRMCNYFRKYPFNDSEPNEESLTMLPPGVLVTSVGHYCKTKNPRTILTKDIVGMKFGLYFGAIPPALALKAKNLTVKETLPPTSFTATKMSFSKAGYAPQYVNGPGGKSTNYSEDSLVSSLRTFLDSPS